MNAKESLEIEIGVLCGCLTDPDGFACIQHIIPSSRAFNDSAHRAIYQAVGQTFVDGYDIDVLTVSDTLHKGNNSVPPNIDSKLVEIANFLIPTIPKTLSYAKRLRDIWVRREVKLIARSATIKLDDYEETAEEHIAAFMMRLNKASTAIDPSKLVDIGKEWSLYLDRFAMEAINPSINSIIPTGYHLLDGRIGGFKRGDLVVIIAAYSVGKSAFMINLAWNASKHKPVAIFSMEMTTDSLTARIIAQADGVDYDIVRRGDASRLSRQWFETGFSGRHIYVDDRAGLSAIDIRGKVAAVVAQKDVRVVFIDHLGLMRWHTKRGGDVENWNQVIIELKRIAKDYGITMVVLNQIDKASILKGRPRSESNRMVGGADPDVIIALWRQKWQEEVSDRTQLEIIIRKAREGRPGTIYADYWPAMHRIRESEVQKQEKDDEAIPLEETIPAEADF